MYLNNTIMYDTHTHIHKYIFLTHTPIVRIGKSENSVRHTLHSFSFLRWLYLLCALSPVWHPNSYYRVQCGKCYMNRIFFYITQTPFAVFCFFRSQMVFFFRFVAHAMCSIFPLFLNDRKCTIRN